MMKKSLMVATFLVVGGSAVGVSAGNPASFKGSDTLFDFTTAMLSNCPGTQAGTPPLAYAGTGSGNGQSAMAANPPTQQIAPMSRFLNNGACSMTGAATTLPHSDGLVVALDGLSIVGSKSTFTHSVCNGSANLACDPNFETNTGAVYDQSITLNNFPGAVCSPACGAGQICGKGNVCVSNTYTFTGGWRDVLRILLAGFDHNNNSTGAAGWAARDCLSDVRIALANSYGNFFENKCAAQSGETATTTCTFMRHIFRRDDFSGTTDTVVSLLNLPAITNPNTTVTVFPGGVSTSLLQRTGSNPFCNAVRPGFVSPQS